MAEPDTQKPKTVMPDVGIDAEIDEFLKIFGTSLRHYTLYGTKEKAREAWSQRAAGARTETPEKES